MKPPRLNGKRPVLLLEIDNPAFPEPLRAVDDAVDRVSQGIAYVGVRFGFALPTDASGSNPVLKLTMSNVGRGLTEQLEKLEPTLADVLTFARITAADPDNLDLHLWATDLPIATVQCTPSTVTATAGADYWMRQPACRQIMDPMTLPGAF